MIQTLQLEHAIGFSGKIIKSVHIHPQNPEFISISGNQLIITNLNSKSTQQHFLKGHDNQITCMTVSNNGKYVASGQLGDNSDVIIWDYDQKRLKHRLSEHDYEVQIVQFSHDDRLLFSCGNPQDKKVFIWDVSNGYIVCSCQMQMEKIIAMKWGGFEKDIKLRDTSRYQFACASQRSISLWKIDGKEGKMYSENINTGNVIREYKCVEFSKNREDFLFAGTSSGDFLCFSLKTKLLSAVITVSALGVQSICSVNPQQILVGCGNGTLVMYKFSESAINPINQTNLSGCINSITCNSQESICATDRGLIYRVNNTNLQKTLYSENHTGALLDIQFQIQSKQNNFSSCSEDGSIRLWQKFNNNYKVQMLFYVNNAGNPLCVTYNDEILFSGWQDGKIRAFNVQDGNIVWKIDNAHRGGVTCITLSKNLKFLCTGGFEGEARVWEMRSKQLITHLKEHTQKITKIKLLGNEEDRLITSSKDRSLLRWDLKNQKRTGAFVQRMGGINSFDTIQDGQVCILVGQDKKITYLNNNQAIKSLDTSMQQKNQYDECMSLCISKSGRFFVTGGSEKIVKVWDVQTGNLLFEGKGGHSQTINVVQISDDESQIISGGKDGNILIWNCNFY